MLSTLLCNYFYGNLEQTLLADQTCNNADTLLLRMVDDFLLISVSAPGEEGWIHRTQWKQPDVTCRRRYLYLGNFFFNPFFFCLFWLLLRMSVHSAALNFLRLMHEGVREYGCEINQGKTQLNFQPALLQQELDGNTGASATTALTSQAAVLTFAGVGWSVDLAAGGVDISSSLVQDGDADATSQPEWLQWCGLYLHTASLRVRGDYSRLCGMHMADTITVDHSVFSRAELTDKLFSFVEPKCQAILLDDRINTVQDIWLNLYQCLLVAAMKFQVFTMALPVHQRPVSNPRLFLSLIQQLFQHTFAYGSAR